MVLATKMALVLPLFFAPLLIRWVNGSPPKNSAPSPPSWRHFPMTETLREKLIRCGWASNFSADTLVKLINRHCADVIRDTADKVVPETTTPWNSTLTPIISAQEVRVQLLAIADELEKQL
jgi:hypothetical protein